MCFEKAGAGGLACTNTFNMKICQYNEPSMPNQVVISDMYDFEFTQNLINADPDCFSDDVSGNGFIQDYTGAAELLIAATQTGDVEWGVWQPGYY